MTLKHINRIDHSSPQLIHKEKNLFLQEKVDPVSSGLGSSTDVVMGTKTATAGVVEVVVMAGLSLCIVWASGGKYVKVLEPDSVMTVDAGSPVGTVRMPSELDMTVWLSEFVEVMSALAEIMLVIVLPPVVIVVSFPVLDRGSSRHR